MFGNLIIIPIMSLLLILSLFWFSNIASAKTKKNVKKNSFTVHNVYNCSCSSFKTFARLGFLIPNFIFYPKIKQYLIIAEALFLPY